MKTTDLTMQEQRFLLFLETCVVDSNCFVDSRFIGDGEPKMIKKFQINGLIKIRQQSKANSFDKTYILGYQVYLTDEALDLAHQLRKKLAKNLYNLLAYNHVKDQKQHLTIHFEGL